MERAGGGIVAALHRAGLRQCDGDAVAGAQALDQSGVNAARGESSLPVEALGGLIERLDMVVIGVEEFADLLERHARAAALDPLIAELRGHRLVAFGQVALAAVERDQRARDRGHVGGELADLSERDRLGCFGEAVAQIGDESRFLVFREELDVNAECLVDLEQDGDGERALVLLDLVEIAGRDA